MHYNILQYYQYCDVFFSWLPFATAINLVICNIIDPFAVNCCLFRVRVLGVGELEQQAGIHPGHIISPLQERNYLYLTINFQKPAPLYLKH